MTPSNRAPLVRRVSTLVLVAVLSCVVASSTSASASVSAAKKGCKYLKLSEVERVTGKDFKKGKAPTAPGPIAVCGYEAASEVGTGVYLWVDTTVNAERSFEGAQSAFDEDGAAVDGFGKNALYVGEGLNTLYVLRGGTLVYVQYVTFGADADPATVQDAVEQLTKIVLRHT